MGKVINLTEERNKRDKGYIESKIWKFPAGLEGIDGVDLEGTSGYDLGLAILTQCEQDGYAYFTSVEKSKVVEALIKIEAQCKDIRLTDAFDSFGEYIPENWDIYIKL